MDTEGEPNWLSKTEEQTWLALTSVMMRLPAALDAQLRRDAGIGHFDYVVMSALSMSEGRTMRLSDLGGLVDASLSRLSHTFNRLERSGWVRRRPDPDNGRYTLAELTDEGWGKVVATAPDHVAEVRRLVIDPLTGEQNGQLRAICASIVEAIGGVECPGAAAPPAEGARP
ncbi:winged helix-turn-helix transcriptional regulator [Gordonia sp. TBRC 11910]|uniref:Winged helix-turn-helix transcriptional regulator n=1 Tax=Gordonia asplenii TaxID=2725283 RepID=A0A848KSF3_9ACTN|nr:MarR family winged helix-turn-helix transcriptional regulator [Gordonia asplenii]NMO01059.1 winged helix-turn-helix transcriptional regulator [Gordonia asplenii]